MNDGQKKEILKDIVWEIKKINHEKKAMIVISAYIEKKQYELINQMLELLETKKILEKATSIEILLENNIQMDWNLLDHISFEKKEMNIDLHKEN